MDAFVEGVICKLAAHASAAHYYAISTAHRHIPAIRAPALFLVAADDPFLGRLPIQEAAANPATMLAVTARSARPPCSRPFWDSHLYLGVSRCRAWGWYQSS